MAGSIYSWSTTFANNGTADGDVPWPEGMARRQVNDSARGIMGRIAEFIGDIGGTLTAGGTANGITVTSNSAFTTYADGQIIAFKAAADNTGAVTLNVNAIGTKAIRKINNTGDVALVAGDIQQDGTYVCHYNSSLNSGAGAWQIVGAPGVSTSTANTWTADQTFTTPVTVSAAAPRIVFDETDNNDWFAIVDGNQFDVRTPTTSGTDAKFRVYANGHTAAADSADNAVFATIGGTGGVFFRPMGEGSATNQMFVSNSGNMTVNGSVTATSFAGSGASITSLDASNLSSGTVPNARISGAYSGITTLTASTLTSTGAVNSSQNFVSTSVNVVLASASGGGVFLRPNGAGSTVGEAILSSSGNLTVNGNGGISSAGFPFTNGATLALRPNGSGSSVGQVTIATSGAVATNGNMTVNGTLTVTG